MIICVDFDGTISQAKFPNTGNIHPLAIPFLQQWKANRHKLILWTCRDGEHLEEALQFCRIHGIEFDAVNDNIMKYRGGNSRKVWADLYVDDKCGLNIDQVWMTAHQHVMNH